MASIPIRYCVLKFLPTTFYNQIINGQYQFKLCVLRFSQTTSHYRQTFCCLGNPFYHPCFMRRSNCSAPTPPRAHHFFCCCPGVLITIIFTCPALYNHRNHPFFECPALFYHTHIFSDPEAARGDGGSTI